MDYKKLRQAKAIEATNRERLLKVNPKLDDESGIYFLTRTDEYGITYFYIGKSIHIMQRMCEHLVKHQHIDNSLKARGFYSEKNPYGWKLDFIHYPAEQLNEMEQYWILEYTKRGYQRRYNKTSGGLGDGEEKVNEFKPPKGYYDGLKQGKKKLAHDLSHIINTHLVISLKPEKANNKISIKALEKFNDLLNEENYH